MISCSKSDGIEEEHQDGLSFSRHSITFINYTIRNNITVFLIPVFRIILHVIIFENQSLCWNTECRTFTD